MDQTINAANNKSMKALKVFKEFLRCLKDDALKTIKSHTTGGEFEASDFTWVLTVPAIWGHPAKQFMRECAIQVKVLFFLKSSIVQKFSEKLLLIYLPGWSYNRIYKRQVDICFGIGSGFRLVFENASI